MFQLDYCMHVHTCIINLTVFDSMFPSFLHVQWGLLPAASHDELTWGGLILILAVILGAFCPAFANATFFLGWAWRCWRLWLKHQRRPSRIRFSHCPYFRWEPLTPEHQIRTLLQTYSCLWMCSMPDQNISFNFGPVPALFRSKRKLQSLLTLDHKWLWSGPGPVQLLPLSIMLWKWQR